MKACRKCNEVKPLDEFPIRKGAKDGYRNECRHCTAGFMARYQAENVASIKVAKAAYREEHLADIAQKNATWREANREILRKKAAARHAANPEPALVRAKSWRERNEDRYAANQRSWREANADKLKEYAKARHAENPQPNRDRRLKWAKDNPDKQRAQGARYEAAKLRATPAWADREAIREFYFAANFLGQTTGEWYHVDHIVPLRSKLVCGLHTEANLRVISGSENCSKQNRYWPDMP